MNIPVKPATGKLSTLFFVVILALSVVTAGCVDRGGSTSTTKQKGGDGAGGTTGDAGADATGDAGDELGIETRITKVARELTPSVVNITVAITGDAGNGGTQRGIGSGVIFSKDGYIITNAHVLDGVDDITVALANGREIKARTVGSDTFSDIAVLKIAGDSYPAARIGSSRKVRVGQFAIAIGSPLGFEHTVTLGVVSALNRQVPEGGPSLSSVLQTDAPISPGNSGGALANSSGELIGINVAVIPASTGASSIGFAIPVDTATSIANQLIKTGRARHPFIGIRQVTLTPEVAQEFGLSEDSGVVVISALPGSPAAQAGLRRGDLITKLDDDEVATVEDLFSLLESKRPGDRVTLTITRDGSVRTVSLTLAERSPDR